MKNTYINTILEKNELIEILQKQVLYFNMYIKDDSMSDFNTTSITDLQVIKSKLNILENKKDIEFLKYLCSSIGNYLIHKLLNQNRICATDLKSLNEALKNVSELRDYAIEARLQLNRNADLIETKDTKEPCICAYYEWLQNDYFLDEISSNLRSEKIIRSVKDFKKLFTKNPVQVAFDVESKEFIIVLFDLLYQKNIIKPKIRKGHFVPLKEFSVDLDNKVLFKRDMKQVKYSVKKNTEKYHKIEAKAMKWIGSYLTLS